MENIKMLKLTELEDLELDQKLEKILNYYKRGAIVEEEFIYLLTQTPKRKDFNNYVEMFLNIIEYAARTEKKNTRKEIIKEVLKRM